MDNESIELSYEAIMNQEWKPKIIIGYGVGIYIGTGVEAPYIIKGSTKEIDTGVLYSVYSTICSRHNAMIAGGKKIKQPRAPWYRRVKAWYDRRTAKPFEYPEMPE